MCNALAGVSCESQSYPDLQADKYQCSKPTYLCVCICGGVCGGFSSLCLTPLLSGAIYQSGGGEQGTVYGHIWGSRHSVNGR